MGTYAIFRQLRQLWETRTHPVYRAELARETWKHRNNRASIYDQIKAPNQEWLIAPPRPGDSKPLKENGIPLVLILIAISLSIIGAAGLYAIVLPSVVCFGFMLFILSWVGYIQIITASSRMVAQEKEQQTWDTLLMLPYTWDELLLAKLAVVLRNYYLDFVLWLQLFFMAGFVGTIVFPWVMLLSERRSFSTSEAPQSPLPYVLLVGLALIATTVGRIQDYILLSLLGASVSIISNNRGIAGAVAMVLGIAYVLISPLSIIFIAPFMNRDSAILVAIAAFVGPMGAIALALPVVSASIAVTLVIALREIMIRVLFGWLSCHLSEK